MQDHQAQHRRQVHGDRRTKLHLALIGGLLAIACASGGRASFEEVALESSGAFSSTLQSVITDEERAAAAGAALDAYREELQRFIDDMATAKMEAVELYTSYGATDEELDAIVDRFKERRLEFREAIVTTFTELEEHLEPGEWNETIRLMADEEGRWKALEK